MKRKTLYSRAARPRAGSALPPLGPPQNRHQDWTLPPPEPGLLSLAWGKTRAFVLRHDRIVSPVAAIAVTLALIAGWQAFNPLPAPLTQTDIDSAVKFTLENTPPGPAETTLAAATIAPSVVRVEGFLSPERRAALAKEEAAEARKAGKAIPKPQTMKGDDKTAAKPAQEDPDATGSGVVITERGDILTNLHVIRSTDRWVVTFADGSKSDVVLVNVQPENDLAVVRARKLPDDMKPASLASTANLFPGDTVVAVGFPFGIGPSVSSGVVSGLKREFADPDNKEKPRLTNLIQFDAAANPGNSGGPLVNRDGEVVGIVTAIYNPTGNRVFAGLGFAVPIENAARGAGMNPL